MKIIVLGTEWKENYWENEKVAPYKLSMERVKGLKESLPLAGIGIYRKGKHKDLSFLPPCFIIVQSMERNEKGEYEFGFRYLSKMGAITSSKFAYEMEMLSLFSTHSHEKVLEALEKLGIKTPLEWQRLLEPKSPTTWKDWIGRHFQELLSTSISNDDYEDRIFEIFTALGFKVEPQGHKKEGEYPDGIAYCKHFAIIYDCKNRLNYFLIANDKRAMVKYVSSAKRRIEEQKEVEKVHFAFVAHSYSNVEGISDIEKDTQSKGFLFTSAALLYLLFKKMSLGPSFALSDFDQLISNQPITNEVIDKTYGR